MFSSFSGLLVTPTSLSSRRNQFAVVAPIVSLLANTFFFGNCMWILKTAVHNCFSLFDRAVATTSFSINNNLWNGPKIVSTTSLKPGEFHDQRKATSKGIKLGNVANNSVRKASPAAAPLKLPVEPVPKSMLEAGKYNGFPSWDEVNPNPPKRFLTGMMSEAVLLTPQSAQRQPQISLRNMDKIEAYRTENPGSNLTFSWQIRDKSVKDANADAAAAVRQHESGYLLTKSVDPLPGGCADEVVLGF